MTIAEKANVVVDLPPDVVAEMQRTAAESKIFSACYDTLRFTAQKMLDELGTKGVPPEQGIEFVHAAIVALDQGFTRLVVEKLGAKEEQVAALKVAWRMVGDQVYSRQWTGRLTAAAPGIVAPPPKTSPLVGLDGRPLR